VGVPAMLECRSSFVKLVKNINPSIIGSYCVIHRQALVAKTLPYKPNRVLKVCIKVVNIIKSSSLNLYLLKILCSGLSAKHSVLLRGLLVI